MAAILFSLEINFGIIYIRILDQFKTISVLKNIKIIPTTVILFEILNLKRLTSLVLVLIFAHL